MAILFACCYVTRWGKFGREFCKQTNVAACIVGVISFVDFTDLIICRCRCIFQNKCNKVEIALRVVQFWSEIKLVITNRTPASRSRDFVITRLISDQIALHSVQLPLFNKIAIGRKQTRPFAINKVSTDAIIIVLHSESAASHNTSLYGERF